MSARAPWNAVCQELPAQVRQCAHSFHSSARMILSCGGGNGSGGVRRISCQRCRRRSKAKARRSRLAQRIESQVRRFSGTRPVRMIL